MPHVIKLSYEVENEKKLFSTGLTVAECKRGSKSFKPETKSKDSSDEEVPASLQHSTHLRPPAKVTCHSNV